MNFNKLYYLLSLIIIYSCSEDYLFTELSSDKTHIDFINEVKEKDKANILDYLYFYNGGGVAIGDINNDGFDDIYFTSNQGKNKLYLNKGEMEFEDISAKAGIEGTSTWDTGVTMADVNGDGWLDIYVCSVVGIMGFEGHNQLFINQKNGSFKEQSADYGLDFQTYSTQATFFDYDKDGDLDMYLLNQNIHNPTSFGSSKLRHQKNEKSGGKLLKNENNKFIDVSEKSGIYGGEISYGLGVSVGDINNDGWDDIFASNDFHEDDYLYINQKDDTFKDMRNEYLTTTSKFSMGNDLADINHDGFLDLITLDMLPDEEKYLKISPTDDDFGIQDLKTSMGYQPQQMRNTLQINQQGKLFNEVAWLYGVAATDWSWSALFADFDKDGNNDLFITNGIAKRPNDMDFIKYISNDEVRSKLNSDHKIDSQVIDKMASGAVPNYIFSGRPNQFKNETGTWIKKTLSISNGATYSDLDNDGDLDLVTNNYNEKATVYQNNSKTNHYLKIKLKSPSKNTFGIGTKVKLYAQGKLFYQELQPTRGFQSSVSPVLFFGLGNSKKIDSIRVIWNDEVSQVYHDIKPNQTVTMEHVPLFLEKPFGNILMSSNDDLAEAFGLAINHKENDYNDFNREKLIPYKISSEGPALAVGDINHDGTEDVFLGGSKNNIAQLLVQINGKFQPKTIPDFEKDATCEDTDAAFIDIDNDGDLDLYVVSGGGEFYGNAEALLDRIYINDGRGNFKKDSSRLPKIYENKSVVRPVDFDNDDDIDLFIGGRAVSNQFGTIPNSYLLINNGKGYFSIRKNNELQKIGMVTDALWTDINHDKKLDLMVVGEWFSPQVFIHENNQLVNKTATYISENLNGLWQSVYAYDIDNDKDTDFLLGNYGLNSRFSATPTNPLRMYIGDFDENGKSETLLAGYREDDYFPLHSKDELAGQLPGLISKKYVYYKDFAGENFYSVFGQEALKKGTQLELTTLASGYLENRGGKYYFVSFNNSGQISPISNFNYIPQWKGVLMTGNKNNISPYIGNINSSEGKIMYSPTNIQSALFKNFNIFSKQISKTKIIRINGKNYIISAVNNGGIMCFSME